MKLFNFINKYLNKHIDYDKYYGAQCVDVFRQYCKDVLNIPHTGAVEGAKDIFLYNHTMPVQQKYFDAFRLDEVEEIKYGDVMVWDKTISNKYGHIAIVISQISDDEILVIEQNGFNQQGLKLNRRKLDNCLGILRYKGVVN